MQMKKELLGLAPIDAFIIKFINDESAKFNKIIENFVEFFGIIAIKSLVILCIQDIKAKRYLNNKFVSILKNSDGYKSLKKLINLHII
jgi:hypothetical protein